MLLSLVLLITTILYLLVCCETILKSPIVQNTAAGVLSGTQKYDHITPVLAGHWLPVVDF